MGEWDDTDGLGDDADTKPVDAADRSTSRQAAAHGDTKRRADDVGPDRTTTADAGREKTDGAHERAELRDAGPGDAPNAERLSAVIDRVSHDLISQFGVAHGRLEIVCQEVDNDDLAKVATALDRMEALIEDLRDGAAAGTERVEIERVSLPTLADQCWQNVAANEATLRNTSALPL